MINFKFDNNYHDIDNIFSRNTFFLTSNKKIDQILINQLKHVIWLHSCRDPSGFKTKKSNCIIKDTRKKKKEKKVTA